MIKAAIKVIPWRETHMILTKFDWQQKIIILFLTAQYLKLKEITS